MFLTARTGYADRSRTSRRRKVETVGSTFFSPREPGTRIAPGPREDGRKVATVGVTCFSPREPGTRIAPGPREDGHTVETVGVTGSSPPEQGMRIASGPCEDSSTRAAVVIPSWEPGNALGSRADDTSRNIPRPHLFRHPPRPGVITRISGSP